MPANAAVPPAHTIPIRLEDCLAADRARLKALWREAREARETGETPSRRRSAAQGKSAAQPPEAARPVPADAISLANNLSNNRARKQAQAGKAYQAYLTLAERSSAKVAARRARLPRPEFAEELPVNARRAEIAALIAAHQVVIVCGETGSGKTTQLPKICLELGRGATGLIGHTQPRRIAARSTAQRIAQELHSEVGQLVGYHIRFTDRSSPDSLIKLMTDGILLAETQGDRQLSAYDTLIIDEAHERSLNIDFLLGYLKQLLPRRPDLKLIITSATIDAERFSRHFNNAPVIEVSGRLYPVETRYRPVDNDEAEREDQRDRMDALVDACDELHREGPGDILVFLPGEREIREAAEALRKHHPPGTEILPLFARLSAEEQGRIFRPHGGRRIVLATNVAETSLTVPGIRYVIDTGLARVKRYSYRNKVEQLQIERISQAAANQRAGRCGRVAAGVCIRLYDEAEFQARTAFTDPEILRSSLAGVILRMKSLGLGEVEHFPFLEAPSSRAIADGYQQLQELNALDDEGRLTDIGRSIARLPLDPKIARMILAAHQGGCLTEVLVIAAALTVQDPRERPQERQGTADAAHARLADERSEFLSWLKLWQWYQNEITHKKSQRKLVQACHEQFLSANRMREWGEVHRQLHALVAEQGWRENQVPATEECIHRALLSGLLGNIGCRSEDSAHYLGARGIKFLVHPGSPLQKKVGRWLMASEITETSRLYARCVAKIDPRWVEEVGAHLLKRTTFDPHWEKKAMQVVAFERTTLYGIVIEPRRRVAWGPHDPAGARMVFIREALVGGEVAEEYARRWAFFRHNRQLIAEIEALEHKSRRPDVLVDDELIAAFYDERLPADVYDGAGFDHWRREIERNEPKRLYLTRDDLMRHEAAGITTDTFPHQLRMGSVDYLLSYHFEPGSPRDGVTLTLPLAQLNQISATRCDWLVPGLLKEKVIQLVKTLPQRLRAKLVPVPDFAEEFTSAQAKPASDWRDKPLIDALIAYVFASRGLHARGWALTPEAFRPDQLPAHLTMNFKLIDEHGRQLGMSRSLAELRAEWGGAARDEFTSLHASPSAHSGLTSWSFGALPELLEVDVNGQRVIGFPGLSDAGESVALTVFDSPEEAQKSHLGGLLRLFMLQFREQQKYYEKQLPELSRMGMLFMPLGSLDELKQQLIRLIFARACLQQPWPENAEAFNQRCQDARARLGLIAQEVCRLVLTLLEEWQQVTRKLSGYRSHTAAHDDIDKQLQRLLHKRFIEQTPFERLQHFPRYLKAVSLRLDKLKNDPGRDARLLAEYQPLWAQCERRAIALARQGVDDPQQDQLRWMLEELRVALFAQELKTPAPVSVKRIQKIWEGMAR